MTDGFTPPPGWGQPTGPAPHCQRVPTLAWIAIGVVGCFTVLGLVSGLTDDTASARGGDTGTGYNNGRAYERERKAADPSKPIFRPTRAYIQEACMSILASGPSDPTVFAPDPSLFNDHGDAAGWVRGCTDQSMEEIDSGQ